MHRQMSAVRGLVAVRCCGSAQMPPCGSAMWLLAIRGLRTLY